MPPAASPAVLLPAQSPSYVRSQNRVSRHRKPQKNTYYLHLICAENGPVLIRLIITQVVIQIHLKQFYIYSKFCHKKNGKDPHNSLIN